MKAKKLDKAFDDGAEDILQHFDVEKASRPNLEKERVNVDFPAWMIDDLDKAAKTMGVPRQDVTVLPARMLRIMYAMRNLVHES